jgi:response regulator RpfG family c-di-GMP phosphodiesterase
MIDDQWLAAQLKARGVVSQAQLDAALQREGGDLCQNLMATGALPETELLKFLGLLFQTRYVTAEKLSTAKIPQWVLDMVPLDVCEQHLVLPVRCDKQKSELSFVTTDPSDPRIREAVQLASGAREVLAYLALRHAIEAAIRRSYKGDIHAFARMDQSLRQNYSEMLSIYEQRLIDFDQGDDASPALATSPASSSPSIAFGGSPSASSPGHSAAGLSMDGLADMPFAATPPAGYQAQPPALGGRSFTASPYQHAAPVGQYATGQAGRYETPSAIPASSGGGDLEALMQRRPAPISAPVTPVGGTSVGDWLGPETYVQTTAVLMNLLEAGQGWRQGHTAEVARFATLLADRAGLSAQDALALRLAALLHDLGKPAEPHLTLFTLEAFADTRALARKIVLTPTKLLESAHLPSEVEQILSSLYERFDGQGMPGKRAGRDIPLGARVLAIVDAFCDLLANPRAPGGRCDGTEAAMQRVLEAGRRRVFDGEVIGLLRQVTSEGTRSQVGVRPHVLVIDADVSATAVLEQKLLGVGYDVRMVKTTAEAALVVLSEKVDLILSEVRLDPVDGFAFLERLRTDARTQQIPFIFVSEQAEAEDVNRGFELGALDYIVKPFTPEVLVAKIKRVLDQR